MLRRDVTREPEAVRASIGLAGQFAAVDENLAGREDLRMVGRLTRLAKGLVRSRADELLEQFDLVDAAGRPVRTYSGGMRRRLDWPPPSWAAPGPLPREPTTGLDPPGPHRALPLPAYAKAFPILFPLIFASSAFVPVDTMPGWLQPFARHQPVSVIIDAARALMIGGPTSEYVLKALAWSAVILAAASAYGVHRYRKAV